MSIEIRAGASADFAAVLRMDGVAFATDYTAQDEAAILATLDPRSFLLAQDEDLVVGATADYRFSMTLPGRCPGPPSWRCPG